MALRPSIWRRPGDSAGPGIVVAKPPIQQATGTLRTGVGYGRGTASLPATFNRLSDIIERDPTAPASDIKTLMRVFDDESSTPTVPIHEWFINSVTDDLTGGASLSGDDLKSMMGEATVEAWDWAGAASEISQFPNWVWGGRNALPDLALADLGSIRAVWEIYLSGEKYSIDLSAATAGTFTLTVLGQTTAAISFDASSGTIENAIAALSTVDDVTATRGEDDIVLVVFDDPKTLTTDMTANFAGITGTATLTKINDGFDTSLNPTFTITVDGDTTAAIAWNANYQTVEQAVTQLTTVDDVLVVGSGTYADPWHITFYVPPIIGVVSTTFAAGTAVVVEITAGVSDPSPITQSQAADARKDPHLFGTYGSPAIEVETNPALLNTGSDWTLRVNATGQFAGSQIWPVRVNPGGLYQASIPVRVTVNGSYRLVIRDQFENLIAWSTPIETPIPADGAYHVLSISDVQIPDDVDRIIFRIAVVSEPSSTHADFYVDWQHAELLEGMAATTVGAMMQMLLDDATVDHVSDGLLWWEDQANPGTTYLDYSSFDDATDSDGAAWADTELSWSVTRGMTYGQVLDQFASQLGYEWDVRVDPTDPDGGVYLLYVWNPDGQGTDYSAADAPAVNVGQGGTRSGPVTKRHVGANRWMVEGDGGVIARAESAASSTAIGLIGDYEPDRSIMDLPTALAAANQRVAFALLAGLAIEVSQVGGVWSTPLRDFGVADTVNVHIPGVIDKSPHRVAAITYTVSNGAADSYNVQFSSEQFGSPNPQGGVTAQGGGGAGGGVSTRQFAPVAEGTRRLLAAFKGLDLPVFPSIPFTGSGTIPWLVAASDSPDAYKTVAGFQCAGTDDQVTIQTALDIVDVVYSGLVWLAPGSYSVTSQPSGTPAIAMSFQRLVGLGGPQGVVISQSDSGKSSPGPIINVVGTLENIAVFSGDADAMHIGGTGSYIRDCVAETDGGTVYAIYSSGGSEFEIIGGYYTSRIRFDNCIRFSLRHTLFDSGSDLYLSGCTDAVIDSPRFDTAGAF
jgi:hypothetical protein